MHGPADPLPGSTAIVSAMTVLGRSPQLFRKGGRPYPPPFLMRASAARRAVSPTGGSLTSFMHTAGAPSPATGLAHPAVVTLHDHGLRCQKKTLIGRTPSASRAAACGALRARRPADRQENSAGRGDDPFGTQAGAHTSRDLACHDPSHNGSRNSASLLRRWRSCLTSRRRRTAWRCSSRCRDSALVGPDSQHKGRSVLIDAFRRLPSGQARLILVGSDTR